MFKPNKLSMAVLASMTTLYGSCVLAQSEPQIEEVVVQGIRASLNRATDRERAAATIQNSIVAEDIGKFPDQNVAESLQRITGVSISRVNGEGSQVSVRSFGPQFNIVKLNDRTLATTTGERSFDFQVLPSELIAGADVIKSPSADLASGSVGAYINVRTARPLDSLGFTATGSVKGNYHSMAEELSPELVGLVSNTFADDTMGFMVGASFKESEARTDRYRTNNWNQYSSDGSGYGLPLGENTLGENGEPTDLAGSRGPGRTIYNMIDESRERTGVNAVFQWQPNEHWSTTVDVLRTELDREYLGSGLQVPNQTLSRYTEAVVSDSGTLLEASIADTDVEMNVTYGLEESITTAYGFNTIFTQDRLTLEFDASHSTAERTFEGDDTTALHYTRFDQNGDPQPSEIVLDYRNDVPDLQTNGSIDVTDISKVRAAWQRYMAEESEDEVTELKLDAEYEIDAGVVKSVQVGTAYSDRAISFDLYGTEFNPETGGETWDGAGMYIGDASAWGSDASLGVLPDSVLTLSDGNFLDGVSGNFPRQWVQIADHQAYRDATQAYLEQAVANGDAYRADIVNAGWDTVYPGPGGSYENEETEFATYLQVNLEGEVGDIFWSGNIGGRYVAIDNTAQGTASTIELLQLNEESSDLPEQVDNTATTSPEYLEVETSEDYFLPSANLKLDFGGGHSLRAAAAKTITRPSLSDSGVNRQESAGVDSPTVAITGGNPYLESYQVSQFDLSYEFYADDDSTYSVAYFYKDISNFISTLTTVGPWEGPIEQSLADAYAANGQTVTYNSSRKENRAGGTVQGVELGALHYFSYLPSFWSGFGIQANYTYAHSEDESAEPINLPLVPEPGAVLEGFAENSYNFVGFYDQGNFQARLAYNWRDNFMNSRSGDGLQPEYTDAYGQLDMSMSYDFTDNLTGSFEAINLTNETRLQYFGQRDRVSLLEMTGVRYQVGLRASF